MDGERFQVHTILLAICKVNLSALDVQWSGWLFETFARGGGMNTPNPLQKKDDYHERDQTSRNEQNFL